MGKGERGRSRGRREGTRRKKRREIKRTDKRRGDNKGSGKTLRINDKEETNNGRERNKKGKGLKK